MKEIYKIITYFLRYLQSVFFFPTVYPVNQMPRRLRLLSIGTLTIMLLTNLWVIFRHLSNPEHCGMGRNHDVEVIQQLEEPMKKAPNKYKPMNEITYSKGNIKVYETKEEYEGGFNISFKLGRWDKARQFKMYDFVSIGTSYIDLSEKYSVSLATQSSVEKLHSIVQVSNQWSGAISAAVYAAGDDEYFILHWYISFLKKCFSSVDTKVSFHLAVPKSKIPTGKRPEKFKEFAGKNHNCEDYVKILKTLTKMRSGEIVKWRTKAPYPQNHMRNLARKNCQSENVFLTDIDIIPSWDLLENLDTFLKSPERKCPEKCAYVIPTYELEERTDFPTDKKDLIRLSKKGLARPFHHQVFIYNQYATNFSKWESYSDTSDDEVTVSHDVTNFEFLYEPFYVAPDTVPEHDERFMGYGYTRNTQVYEMFVSGYQFQVLSPIFTIHWGLQRRLGRPMWREKQNEINRQLFEVFKREVYAKYKKDPLKMMKVRLK